LHTDARDQVLALIKRISAPGALICLGIAEDAIGFTREKKPPQSRMDAPIPIRQFAFTPQSAALDVSEIASKPIAPTPEPTLLQSLPQRLASIEDRANGGDFFNANGNLDALLVEFPISADAWFLRGVLASAQGDLTQAQVALARANYLEPSHSRALQLRAELARRTGNVAQADRLSAQLKRTNIQRAT
jgi:chemotaxis protein methyltransferase WspC